MDRRITKTKTAIKSAYTELLKEKKTSKITITEIARRANIDRKTFYLHYNSTDDIVHEIIEDNLSDFTLMLNKNPFSMHPIDATLILQCLNTCIMKNIDFYECISKLPDFEHFENKTKEFFINKMIHSLSESTNLSSIEIKVYSRFFMSGIIDIYGEWFRNDTSISLDELGELSGKAIYNGIQVLK